MGVKIRQKALSCLTESDQFFGDNIFEWEEIQIDILHQRKPVEFRMAVPVNTLQSEWLHERHQLAVRHVVQFKVFGHQVLAAHQLLVLLVDELANIIFGEEHLLPYPLLPIPAVTVILALICQALN